MWLGTHLRYRRVLFPLSARLMSSAPAVPIWLIDKLKWK